MRSYFLICLMLVLVSQSLAQQYIWTQKTSLPASGRVGIDGFAIGNKGYLGLGVTSSGGGGLSDWWEYNPASDSWTQKANFIGSMRFSYTAFSIGNYGYVGLGWTPIFLFQLQDFWKYDPANNTWTAVANYGGTARYTSSDFVINGEAYVGLGYVPLKSDFHKYNPTSNSWSSVANFGGGTRQSAASFELNGKGYVSCGASGGNYNDLWEYDPALNQWTQKANFPGSARYGSVGFSLCNKGVIGTGGNGSVFYTDFYSYDQVSNSWSSMASFAGLGRRHAAGFVINNRFYVCGGTTNGTNGANDLWELSLEIPSVSYAIQPCSYTVNFTCIADSTVPYFWDFGDGDTSSLQNPTHTYADTGTFNVQLITQNNCSSDTLITPIIINPVTAVSDFSFTLPTLCDTTVVFNNQSQNANIYSWYFGDGDTSLVTSPTHAYSPGNYTATLIAYNACGNDTFQQSFTINPVTPPADAAFIYNINTCDSLVSFTNQSSNGTSYWWSFGDGDTSSLQNPTHIYASAGTYNVQLITQNNCSIDTSLTPVTVSPFAIAAADFSFTLPAQCDSIIVFSNQSQNALSYWWDFGDGDTSLVTSPTHAYSPGNYTATLIAYNACGNDTFQQSFTVNPVTPPADAAFNYNINTCDSLVSFTNQSSNGTSYWWSFGDGDTSSLQNPTHIYASAGTYSVQLITQNNCSIDTSLTPVTVSPFAIAAADFSFTLPAQCDSIIVFSNQSQNALSYWWDLGDGDTSIVTSPTHAYSPGNYTATLIAYNACSNDTFQQSFTINPVTPPADAAFIYNINTCDSLVSFTNQSSNGTSYWWSFGDGDTSNANNPSHAYNAGNYTATLIAYNTCSNDTFHQNIIINPLPAPAIASFSYAADLCDPTVIFSDQSSNAVSYYWSFGDGDTSSLQNPSHMYSASGNYNVQLITQNLCSADTSEQLIEINFSAGMAAINIDMQPCAKMIEVQSISQNAFNYHWDFGDGSSNTSLQVNHLYGNAGIYVVTLTINEGTLCEDTAQVLVTIKEELTAISVPNAFTPNNDGVNDLFVLDIDTSCDAFNLKIFDRWGKLVFETDDLAKSWDGTFNNEDVTEGIYLYVLKGEKVNKSGMLSLFR